MTVNSNGGPTIHPQTVVSIADGLDVVPLSECEVLIQYGTRSYPSELLRASDLSGMLSRVVGRLLGGPTTVGELLAELDDTEVAEAQAMLSDLLERGILTDARCSPVEQYLHYTFTGASALTAHSVAILGAGPLGTRIAEGLAEHGLGHLAILDDRSTESLKNAFPHAAPGVDSRSEAGMALVESLKFFGYRDAEVLGGGLDATGVERAVESSGFLILALERPDPRLSHVVNRYCLRENKAWVLATIDGNFGLVGPLFSPPDTACYNCYRTLADAATPHREIARKYREHLLRRGSAGFGVGMPAYAEITAGYTALAAIRFLLGAPSFAVGRVLVMNFARMLFEVEDVLKLPRCPVCGGDKSVYRPAFSPEIVNLMST
jgi:bacteriocin biosynthesis cyclodehydratase domain-containing protein